MNWDQFNEQQKPLRDAFMKKMGKLEMETAMGKIDESVRQTIEEDCRNLLEQMFENITKLQSIEESKETMFMMLADVLGVKGEERQAMVRGEMPNRRAPTRSEMQILGMSRPDLIIPTRDIT